MTFTIVIFIVGTFFNPQTGSTVNRFGEVPDVMACAQLVNDTRDASGTDALGGYYLTDAKCMAFYRDQNGNLYDAEHHSL